MAIKGFGCERPDCRASTGICEHTTFGTGELSDWGYFEHPCFICARAWEKLHPEQVAWPFKKMFKEYTK